MKPLNRKGVAKVDHHTTQSRTELNQKKVKRECEQNICSVKEVINEKPTREHRGSLDQFNKIILPVRK